MGLFDKMFGRGASEEEQTQQRFDELKQKYNTVLGVIEQQDVQVQNLHVEEDKLFIKGIAPSAQAKDLVWDQVKLTDPEFPDITVNIDVNESIAEAAPAAGSQSYTVQSGDSLSKISQHFYGNANEYMRIFYANRDKLSDPNMIQVGQELVIPPDDNA